GLVHSPFDWNLHPTERTLAQILDSVGYQTHLFGLQHISTDTARLGFETVHPVEGKALGGGVSATLCDFLRSHRPDRPLYLEVNVEEVHRPFTQGGAQPDSTLGVTVPGYLPSGRAATDEMASMQGAVRQADMAAGVVLGAIAEAGMAEDSFVIFTADHGIAMPRAKCTLYDPGIEAALLMRWPSAGILGGRVVPELISNVDILPTLLEAIDMRVPEGVQGRTFMPLLDGQPYVPRSAVYAEKTYHTYYDPMRCLRTERFKYIRHFETSFAVEVPGDVQLGPIFREHVALYHASENPQIEMYDLAVDPLEERNLAGNPTLTEVEAWLDSRLHSWMSQTEDPLLDGPIASPSYRRAMTPWRTPSTNGATYEV
ncbi:MAG: sulfatase-like hydrolase/transferase, partial [Chloroflexota bacterium]|nr:sulfatase-like hydrolase/transferase [Chloroflexota bacterium]